MWNKSTKDSHSPLFDFKVLILHAVEEHQQILILRNEWVKLRIQVLQHSDSDTVLIIGSCCNKEAMEELVDDALHR